MKKTEDEIIEYFYHEVIDPPDFDLIIKRQNQASRQYQTRIDGYKARLITTKIAPHLRESYVIETIYKWVESDKRTIPYSVFGFLYEEVPLLNSLLDIFKEKGFFDKWMTNPYKNNLEYVFSNVNLLALKSFLISENQVSLHIFNFSNFQVNDETKVISYKNKVLKINSGTMLYKLLYKLLSAKGDIAFYRDIAKFLGINSCGNEYSDIEVAKAIQCKIRDLKKRLKSTLKDEIYVEISNKIINETNSGYKIAG